MVQQESLFPDLDQVGDEVADHAATVPAAVVAAPPAPWRIGDDVSHRRYGHGWVQGAGHGVMTVRFETRDSGPGVARTFSDTDDEITRADPVASLDWQSYLDGLYQNTE